MKKIAVAILSIALIASSISVQAKSSTGKTLTWVAAGAIAGYAIKSAMGEDNKNQQASNYPEQNVYRTSDGCLIKSTRERLSNGNIREVQVKECNNNY